MRKISFLIKIDNTMELDMLEFSVLSTHREMVTATSKFIEVKKIFLSKLTRVISTELK